MILCEVYIKKPRRLILLTLTCTRRQLYSPRNVFCRSSIALEKRIIIEINISSIKNISKNELKDYSVR